MIGFLPSWIGRSLRSKRAGADKTLFNHSGFASTPADIIVESTAFKNDGPMPTTHSADGASLSPPLSWRGVPASAISTVLVIEDADSPTAMPFVHLIAWNLPGKDGEIRAGVFKSSGNSGEAFKLGRNGMFGAAYTPPDPPPGHGPHRYFFQIFALDRQLEFKSSPGYAQLLPAIQGHVIAKGVLTGIYERP